MQATIGEFLLTRLKQIGIDHIIGVPGDYNLQFLEQVPMVPGISFVGTCNELNAAYAADGYARLAGVSALLTTYGVGELSALCGVAGACAEHVPIVCITGAPPLFAMQQRWLLHHTLADGNFDNMAACYEHFTAAQTRLTPINAATEIDRVLRVCLLEKRPVYIQLPSDISFLTIAVPDQPFTLHEPASDPARLAAALDHLSQLYAQAKRPAVLLDMDADRFGLSDLLRAFIDRTQTQYAALSTGKAILDETDPLALGLYAGRKSSAIVREHIEQSDFLLTTSPRFIEGNSGLFTQSLPPETINLGAYAVTIGSTFYEGVVARDLLVPFIDQLDRAPAPAPIHARPSPAPTSVPPSTPLRQARMWRQLTGFLEPNDVVIAEAGTSNIALTGETLPPGVTYIASNIWGAIGYTLPALLGTMLAAADRRHILFIGDGSFQLTAQELSTLLRLDLKPIIFLLNNRGYTIERFILGMQSAYNDVANWHYTGLPAVFAPERAVQTFKVATEGELATALQAITAGDQAALVELQLDPFDAPAGLKIFGPATAAFDYGPCGPRPAPAPPLSE